MANNTETKQLDDEVMLTTVDNPYNPFTEFDAWLSFDSQKGYNTLGYLARIAKTSPALSDSDYLLEIQTAMREIVRENIYGVHRLFSRNEMKPIPL